MDSDNGQQKKDIKEKNKVHLGDLTDETLRKKIELAIENGDRCFEQSEFTTAIIHYINAENFLKNQKNQDEKKLTAYLNLQLGECYKNGKKNEWHESIAYFEEAGKIYFELGEFDKAVYAYQQALNRIEKSKKHSEKLSVVSTQLVHSKAAYQFKYPIKDSQNNVLVIPDDKKKPGYTREVVYKYPLWSNPNIQTASAEVLIKAAAMTLQGVVFLAKSSENIAQADIELHTKKPKPENADKLCERIADLIWLEKIKDSMATQLLLKKPEYQFVQKAVLKKLEEKQLVFKSNADQCLKNLKIRFYELMVKACQNNFTEQQKYQSRLDANTDSNSLADDVALHFDEKILCSLGVNMQLTNNEKASKYFEFTNTAAPATSSSSDTTPAASPYSDELATILQKYRDARKLRILLKHPKASESLSISDKVDHYAERIAKFTKTYYSQKCNDLRDHSNSITKWFCEMIEKITQAFRGNAVMLRRSSSTDGEQSEESSNSSSDSSSASYSEKPWRSAYFRTHSQKTLESSYGNNLKEVEQAVTESKSTTVLI